MAKVRIALAQQAFRVGDLQGNLGRALDCLARARNAGANLLLLPEMALTGYPPEDLLLREGFVREASACLQRLVSEVRGIDVITGHPRPDGDCLFNSASWIRDGRILGHYDKQRLPNYAVFDERRYFRPGREPLVREVGGCPMGVILCEDAWTSGPAAQARAAGAACLLIPNASPYHDHKQGLREQALKARHAETALPMAYCNVVGGQDDLVFDGRSMLVDGEGVIAAVGPLCEEALLIGEFDPATGAFTSPGWPSGRVRGEAEVYRVLLAGLTDYTAGNGFTDVVIGLSGGIDSALTLALCADALGAERVHAVMMPGAFTSKLSLELASAQADVMGVDYRVTSIDGPLQSMMKALESAAGEGPEGVTHENLQARIRGMILMALSNQHGWLPVATSNKSELAVGYSTLYGDMCGGFAPLKDCLKTRVYDLARYRNSIGEVIPQGVIDRPPTAELRPGQTDQDKLPPYELLDSLLLRFIDHDQSVPEMVADGFDEATVRRVASLVLQAEYKRRQGAPGTRVTQRGFGRDRRYPITSGWRGGEV